MPSVCLEWQADRQELRRRHRRVLAVTFGRRVWLVPLSRYGKPIHPPGEGVSDA